MLKAQHYKAEGRTLHSHQHDYLKLNTDYGHLKTVLR
jgi:hypothetical protein